MYKLYKGIDDSWVWHVREYDKVKLCDLESSDFCNIHNPVFCVAPFATSGPFY